jgi:ubiquinone/menaquinone biosynthesis C-methylase UbiE
MLRKRIAAHGPDLTHERKVPAMASETFQLSIEAAEVYESAFVPAFFAQWAPHLVDVAGVTAGQAVLDVACGTGIVARAAAERVGASGRVVGVDLNEAMLAVAQRIRPDLEWRRGDVAALPFADGSFDVVLCSFALMFFPDPVQALREMGRVATPHGTVAVLVPGTVESCPGWPEFIEVAARHAGPQAVPLLTTYFALGDLEQLMGLFNGASLEVTAHRTHLGTYRSDSVDTAVANEVHGTPLGERISDEVYGRILRDAREVLRPFVTADGHLEMPFEGHLVAARPR